MSPTSLRRHLGATALFLLACLCLAPPAVAGRLAAPLSPKAAPTALVMKAAGGYVEVVEFYNATLAHFFISADPAEIAVLDGGAFGGAWRRTGNTFPAWDVTGAPAGTVPVCRFFGTDRYRVDGSRIGPNSHFYTADPAECAYVKTAWQSLASDGRSYPAWTFESNAFAVKLPVNGTCPAGTQPLYRSYNNGARGDPNHRYSLQSSVLQSMAGWAFEGLVMCLPQGTAVAYPPQVTSCEDATCPTGSTRLGNGQGLVDVVITVTNPGTDLIELVVPQGQTFVAVGAQHQDGLALEMLRATVLPGTSRTFVLSFFCMQQSRSAAHTGTSYAPGPLTGNAALKEIVTLTNGKLGPAFDPMGLKSMSAQFAVWEITDHSGALSATQRDLFMRILATPGSDPVLIDLTQQFFSLLSP